MFKVVSIKTERISQEQFEMEKTKGFDPFADTVDEAIAANKLKAKDDSIDIYACTEKEGCSCYFCSCEK